jgi:hypothetical protein
MYFEVDEPAGPTTITTFRPAAWAVDGWMAIPPNAKAVAMNRMTPSRIDRWRDARWAPVVGTGKTLASSLPEHRAGAR